MTCAFLDSFFYIALMSFSLYTYNRHVKITFCPLHNPLDFGHHNESYVTSETSPSVYFYGFTAISLIGFFLFFLIDAIAGENTMQLIVSMITSVLVTYYTVYKSIKFKGLNYAYVRVRFLLLHNPCAYSCSFMKYLCANGVSDA